MQALFSGFGGGGRPPAFRLGSIPVRVDFGFLIMGALLGFDAGSVQNLAIWIACLFVSVLAHEMGHALTYRSMGAQAEVLLYGGGGLTWGRRERPFSTGESVFVSVAGPFTGLALGGAIFAFKHFHGPFASPTAAFAVMQLLWINLIWSLFNLLPVLPMDGGHVLESLLCVKDPIRGRVWARYVSIGACLALAPVVWIFFKEPFAIALLLLFAMQSFQSLAAVDPRRKPAEPPRPAPPAESPDVIENLGRLHKLLGEDRPQEARAVAHQVLDAARGAGARDAALRALAWIAIGQGEPQEALKLLGKTSPRFDDPLTWGTAIAASGDAKGALPHLAQAFARTPDPQVVAAYARCLIAVGKRSEAMTLAPETSPLEVQRALGEALFRSRDFSGSGELSKRLFASSQSPLDAYNVACAQARQGQGESALEWLRIALDAGFDDGSHLADDPDLESLHGLDGFGALVQRLTKGEIAPSI